MRKRPPVPSSLPQPITQLPPTTPLFLIPLSLIIPVTPRSAGPEGTSVKRTELDQGCAAYWQMKDGPIFYGPD